MERYYPKACVCEIFKVYLNWYGSYDRFSKPKHRFWNLNADSEVKVKVTGVKNLTCMERCCPMACVCQIFKVYLNWYGSYDQFSKPKRRFWNLNADSEIKVKVTGVKILICMARSCPKACVCQILKVYLTWYESYDQFSKPKRRFWNLNADSEVKGKVKGVKILTYMERSCPKSCACQILKVYLNWNGSYDQFSKPKRRFCNLNADSEVKVKVTGVKILAGIERSYPRACVCQI